MVLYTVGSKANVGYVQVLHEPGDSCDYYGTLISASNKYCLFVNTKNPSNASGLLDNIKMYVYYCLYYYDDNGINKFIEPYYKICSVYTNSGNYEIRSSSDWLGGSDTSIGYFNPREISHDSLGITMYNGDYIGVLFDFTRTGGTNEKIILPTDDYDTTNHGKYKTDSSLLTSWDLLSYPENGRIYLYGELVEDPNSGGGGEEEENPIGGGIGGTPKQSCHTDSGIYEVGETTVDTWGKLQPQDFGTSGGEDAVYVDMVYPWDEDGEWQTDEVLVDGVTKVFDNPDDPIEHVSYNVNLFIGSPSTMYDIYECWWKESETGDVYVSLDGSDSNFGTYWDDAYRTMTKGVSEVSDGQFVNIDEGIYASETSPFPNNKSCNFELRNEINVYYSSAGNYTGNATGSLPSKYLLLSCNNRVPAKGKLIKLRVNAWGSTNIRLNVYKQNNYGDGIDPDLSLIGNTGWYNVGNYTWLTQETIDLTDENIYCDGGEVIGICVEPISSSSIMKTDYNIYDNYVVYTGNAENIFDTDVPESVITRSTTGFQYSVSVEHEYSKQMMITGEASYSYSNIGFTSSNMGTGTYSNSNNVVVLDKNFAVSSLPTNESNIFNCAILAGRGTSPLTHSGLYRIVVARDDGDNYLPVYLSDWRYLYINDDTVELHNKIRLESLQPSDIFGVEIKGISGTPMIRLDTNGGTDYSIKYEGSFTSSIPKSNFEDYAISKIPMRMYYT